MLYVLVWVLLTTPDERMVYSDDGLNPTIFVSRSECEEAKVKHEQMLRRSKSPPYEIGCIRAELRNGI